jgi:hypothetical protein
MSWKSEQELAAVVVAWLQDLRWDVYQEVQIQSYEPIADIVAVNERGLTWIVETKRSFGFKVLSQADEWIGSANYVSVAVPMRRGNLSRLEVKTLKWLGIGCLYIYSHQDVSEQVQPRLQRRLKWKKQIKEYLTEKHKTFASAGNAAGRRLTPFQNTCDEILREVRWSPGITLKELLSKVSTHYHSTATAKSCILQWGKKGIIRGVRFEKDGKVWRLYERKAPLRGKP